MQQRNRSSCRALAVLVLAGGALVAALACGCSGGIYAETPPVYGGGYDTYYAEYVPANIYAYPRAYYNGSYAYDVDGRWYYPYGDRWVIFRNVPPQIMRQRPYVQQAPPAYRGYPPGYGPGYQGAPAYPPPAQRVR